MPRDHVDVLIVRPGCDCAPARSSRRCMPAEPFLDAFGRIDDGTLRCSNPVAKRTIAPLAT